MPACAVESASSAAAVSAERRVCTSDTAASAASEPSSATSSRRNGRRVRLAANSTPTNCAVHQQRRPADRDEPLLADGGVDLGGVPVALVGGVVGRPVGPPGLGHEPAEPGPGGQPQRLEPGGDGAGGGAHVGVAALRVGQREVGDVGGQQGAGPAHDGVEHAAGVGARGEVAGGVDQRRQLGLAAAARVDPGPDGQGERAGGGPVDADRRRPAWRPPPRSDRRARPARAASAAPTPGAPRKYVGAPIVSTGLDRVSVGSSARSRLLVSEYVATATMVTSGRQRDVDGDRVAGAGTSRAAPPR